jgi:hypothetical protein
MTDDKKIEVKPETFAKRYQELCEELGYRIVVTPVYTARDDGTFSLVLQYSVGLLPKPESK